jgi:DNA-binding NarL/FixJ family response regulator
MLLDRIVPKLRTVLFGAAGDMDHLRVMKERQLSQKQYVILRDMAEGLTVQESAKRLSVSYDTVRSHRTRVFRALGVRNAVEAVVTAHHLGLLDINTVKPAGDLSNWDTIFGRVATHDNRE